MSARDEAANRVERYLEAFGKLPHYGDQINGVAADGALHDLRVSDLRVLLDVSRPRVVTTAWVEVVVATRDELDVFYEQGRLNGQAFCVDRDNRYWLAWDSEDGAYFQRPPDEDDPKPLREAGGVLADLDSIEHALPLTFVIRSWSPPAETAGPAGGQ